MSTKLSSTTALHEVRAASTKSELGVAKGGPNEVLGATITANAESGSDRVLYHVFGYNAAAPNVAKRGEAIPESGPLYQATIGAAGLADTAVTVAEASGDQTWVYVKASGVDIERGQLVSKTAAGTYDGVAATVAVGPGSSPHLIAGVAQHKIPANHYGWLLVKGKGVVNCDGAVVNGESLSPSTLAAGVASGLAPGSKGLGVALAAGTAWAAGLSDATLALLDI